MLKGPERGVYTALTKTPYGTIYDAIKGLEVGLRSVSCLTLRETLYISIYHAQYNVQMFS